MAQQTDNLNLTLPEPSEYYSLDVWNNNMRQIDESVGDKVEGKGISIAVVNGVPTLTYDDGE